MYVAQEVVVQAAPLAAVPGNRDSTSQPEFGARRLPQQNSGQGRSVRRSFHGSSTLTPQDSIPSGQRLGSILPERGVSGVVWSAFQNVQTFNVAAMDAAGVVGSVKVSK